MDLFAASDPLVDDSSLIHELGNVCPMLTFGDDSINLHFDSIAFPSEVDLQHNFDPPSFVSDQTIQLEGTHLPPGPDRVDPIYPEQIEEVVPLLSTPGPVCVQTSEMARTTARRVRKPREYIPCAQILFARSYS